MKIDTKAIKKLAELLEETGLSEIEVAEGDQMIRVNKGAPQMMMGGSAVMAPKQDTYNMPSDPTIPREPTTTPPATVTGDHPGAVTSPMVGTAYSSPDPDAAPYVKKGSTVKEGDTLLIIEAMKVMNPIKASKGGTVTQVLFENGQPVEYGDVLLVIE